MQGLHAPACTSKGVRRHKMASSSTSVPWERPNRPLPYGRCYKINKWIFTYSLDAFRTAAFELGPTSSECMQALKSSISAPSSVLGLLNFSPISFQSWTLWGSSLVQIPRVRMPNVGHEPLGSQGEAPDLWDASQCVSPFHRWGFWWDHVSTSPTNLNVAFLNCSW